MKLTIDEVQLLAHLLSRAEGLGRTRAAVAERLRQKTQRELGRHQRERVKLKTQQADNLREYGSPFGACLEEGCGKPAYTEWKASDGTKIIFCKKHNDEYIRESKMQMRAILPTLCTHDVIDVVRMRPGLTRAEVLAKVQASTHRGYTKKLVEDTISDLLEQKLLTQNATNQLHTSR